MSVRAESSHRTTKLSVSRGALAHLPSGVFTANAAWLVCAATAHNLTRAAGALAGGRHVRSRTATIRPN